MRRAVVWIGAGVISFGVALVIAGVGGCNVHEFGHLVAGRALGVPVDDVIWCTPTSGRIAFAYQEPALVGYAGVTGTRTIWNRSSRSSSASSRRSSLANMPRSRSIRTSPVYM